MVLCRFILQAVSLLAEYTQSLHTVRNSQLPATSVLFEICWTRWSRSEEEARLKEIEDQNLYRYRERTHVIEEDDDESLERELQKLFPDYQNYLEEEEEEGKKDEEDEERMEEERSGSESLRTIKFSPEEIEAVANLHMLLYGDGKATDSQKSAPSAEESYALAAYLARPLDPVPGKEHVPLFSVKLMYQFCIGLEYDCSLLASHINISTLLLDSLNATTNSSRLGLPVRFNISSIT